LKTLLKVLGGVVLMLLAACGGYAAYISTTWEKDWSAVEKPKLQASTDEAMIERGEYLAHSVSHCSICHVPEEVTLKRQLGEHPPMSGGFKWDMGPLGRLYSRNITPDAETGIGKWSDEELARAIKWGVGRDGKLLMFMAMSVPAMSDEDVQAIISYLRSTAPVKNAVPPHEYTLMSKWLATQVTPDFRKQLLEGLTWVAPGEEPSVERGRYLANGPAYCVGCHTPFDLMSMKVGGARFSGNADAEPDHKDAAYVYRIPNLTPDSETGHIAKWDEEQFVGRFRAGRVLASSKMPWEAYREMTDADLRSVYRYLKSLPPVKHYIGSPRRKADEDPAKDPGFTPSPAP
jgi:mono/diheme cytochrome c family protein